MTIEEECRLHHRIVELAVWVPSKLVPLCQHGNRMCFLNCLLRSAAEDQPLLIDLHVVVPELFHGILLLDLGVEDMHNGTILHQHLHHFQRWCLSHIASVLLESEAEDSYLLVCNSVEEAGDYLVSKVFLLVLVHIDDLLPVLCAFVQAFALADVHQVQDVLLEARTTEAHGSPKELRTNPRICADSPRDLSHISARLLAQLRNGVHAAHALSQHGIGNKFLQLGAPEIRSQDSLLGHPICIDVREHTRRSNTICGRRATDQDSVRRFQIPHGSPLCEELWIRQDPARMAFLSIRADHLFQGLRRAHRHCRLFDDDFRSVGIPSHCAADTLDEAKVCCPPGAYASDLRWRVHSYENDVGLLDGFLDVSREEQIFPPAALDNIL